MRYELDYQCISLQMISHSMMNDLDDLVPDFMSVRRKRGLPAAPLANTYKCTT